MKASVVVLGLIVLVPGLLLLAVGIEETNYYESDQGIIERNDGVDDEQDEDYYQMYQWFQLWGALLFTVGLLTLLLGLLMKRRTRRIPQRPRQQSPRHANPRGQASQFEEDDDDYPDE